MSKSDSFNILWEVCSIYVTSVSEQVTVSYMYLGNWREHKPFLGPGTMWEAPWVSFFQTSCSGGNNRMSFSKNITALMLRYIYICWQFSLGEKVLQRKEGREEAYGQPWYCSFPSLLSLQPPGVNFVSWVPMTPPLYWCFIFIFFLFCTLGCNVLVYLFKAHIIMLDIVDIQSKN